MPAPLLHVQGASRLERTRAIPEPLASAVHRFPWCYRLGAVLPDLPLFDAFWLKVALFLAHVPYPRSRWAALLHARGAGSLAACVVRNATGPTREPILAVASGLVTHIALDRVMHVAVEAAVREHLRLEEMPEQLHEAIENYQCLEWHRRHVGADGLGTALLRRELDVIDAGAGDLPSWLAKSLRGWLEEVYGVAPSRSEVRRWARGLLAYRDVLSTPLGKLSTAASERMGRDLPWVGALPLEDAFERGVEVARRHLAATAAAADDAQVRLDVEVGDGPLA